MNFLSSIGSAIGNAYNATKSFVSSIPSYFSGTSQSANALQSTQLPSFVPPSSYGAAPQPTGTANGVNYYNNYTPNNASSIGFTPVSSYPGLTGNVPTGISFGTQLPVTITSGPSSGLTSSGGSGGFGSGGLSGGSGGLSGGSGALQTQSQPVTISRNTLSTQSSGLAAPSGVSSFVPTSSGVGSSSASLVLPSAPTSVNPGRVDTTGLAGAMAGYYTRNADGTYVPVNNNSQNPNDLTNQTDQQIAARRQNLVDSILGKKPDVYSDPDVVAAMQQRQQIQQAIQAPTAELNAIVAQQNQDLLKLRQQGAQEGATEAVYGGQQNAINYNAAIRSLPLQASLSAMQGQLKLAQDYLDNLTTVKKNQIDNQFEYNKNLFDSISGALDRKDQEVYQQMVTQNQRQYDYQQNLIKTQDDLLKNAVSQGAPSSVITAINNAPNQASAINAAGSYAMPVQSTIANASGRQLLVNSNTGQIIKDLGAAPINAYSFAGTPAGTVLANAISNGQIAPEQVNSRNASLLANVLSVNPNFNVTQANAAASFFSSSGTQEKLAWSNSVTTNLDLLNNLSANVPRTQLPAINNAILAGKTLTGDTATVQFVNAANRTAAELSKVLGDSGGSDFRTRLANELLNPSYSPEQFTAAITTEKQMISSLQNSFYNQGGQQNPNSGSNPFQQVLNSVQNTDGSYNIPTTK